MGQNAITQSKIYKVVPTVAGTSHALGDSLGGIIELGSEAQPIGRSSRPSGVINAVYITDQNDVGADLDVLFFEADEQLTAVDDATYNPTTSELRALIGCARVTTHISLSTNGFSFANNLGIPFQLRPGFRGPRRLYAVIVAAAVVDHSAGPNALQLGVHILLD